MVQMANACSRMGDRERVRTVCLDLAGQVSINRNRNVKLQAASLLEKHGYFDDALAVYEQLGRLVGTGYQAQEAQRRIVRLYMRANRFDELLEALPDTILPLDAQRCEHIAEELQNQGRYAKAIQLYTRIVASRPQRRRAREALARCYNATGDYAREAEQWAILADEAPGKSNYVSGLASAWRQAEQHDKVVEALTRLIERWPTPQHCERLAAYYVSQEQYDKAIEAYTKLLERHPNHGRALLALGNAHLAAGDKTSALAAWHKIPTAQPTVNGWMMLADA
jgi:tetratricopeptide (TPR) repeat protein